MRRRAFIAGLGSAAAWPVVVRGQQTDRVRRIGALLWWAETDPLSREDFAIQAMRLLRRQSAQSKRLREGLGQGCAPDRPPGLNSKPPANGNARRRGARVDLKTV